MHGFGFIGFCLWICLMIVGLFFLVRNLKRTTGTGTTKRKAVLWVGIVVALLAIIGVLVAAIII